MNMVLICGLLGIIERFLVLRKYIKEKIIDKWDLIIVAILIVLILTIM